MIRELPNRTGRDAPVDLSAAFRALGHPHRLTIVRRLMERRIACCEGERVDDCTLDPARCSVGELLDDVACSPSTLSHHLKELEGAGVIERARDGRRIFCRVDEARLDELRRFLAAGRGGGAGTGPGLERDTGSGAGNGTGPDAG